MKLRRNKILAALVLLTHCAMAVDAAEPVPELDEQQFNKPGISESQRRYDVSQALRGRSMQLKKSGKYAEALRALDSSLKVDNVKRNGFDVERAQLLILVGRKTEGQRLLDAKFPKGHIFDDSIGEPYIEYLLQEKRYDDAVKASKRIDSRSFMVYEQPAWFLARSLLASGQSDLAIDTAKKYYYHFAHQGLPSQKLYEFLNTQGPGLTELVRNKELNDEVVSKIKRIRTFTKQITETELDTIFPEALKGSIGGNFHDRIGAGFTLVSRGGVLWMDDCNNCSILVLHIDTDRVSLTTEDIQNLFGKAPLGKSCESPHSQEFYSLTYRSEEPEMRFAFPIDGLSPLKEVRFGWKLPPDQIPKPLVSKAKTLEETQLRIEEARNELKTGSFKKAAKTIMECWEDSYGDRDRAAWYSQMQEKRELLAKAYDGMKQASVAEFVRNSPIETIHSEIITSEFGRGPMNDFEEYKQKPWKITTYYGEGTYLLTYDRYNPPFWINKDTRWYADFLKYYGAIKVGTEQDVAPLPMGMIDKMDRAIFDVP